MSVFRSHSEMGGCVLTHKEVVGKYREVMGTYMHGRINQWYPNGLNSIRIINNDQSSYVFTYVSDEVWSIESISYYITYTMPELGKREIFKEEKTKMKEGI